MQMNEKIKYGSLNEIPVWISSNLWKDSADIYIYIYISDVQRLTLDAEENDLQHVLRAARAGLRKAAALKELKREAGLGKEVLQYLDPHNHIGLQ